MSSNKLLLTLVDYLIDKYQDTKTDSFATSKNKSNTKEVQTKDNDIHSMFSDSFDDFVKEGNNTPSSQTVSTNGQKSSTQQKTKVTDSVFDNSTKQEIQKPNVQQKTQQNKSKEETISNDDFPDSFGDFDFE